MNEPLECHKSTARDGRCSRQSSSLDHHSFHGHQRQQQASCFVDSHLHYSSCDAFICSPSYENAYPNSTDVNIDCEGNILSSVTSCCYTRNHACECYDTWPHYVTATLTLANYPSSACSNVATRWKPSPCANVTFISSESMKYEQDSWVTCWLNNAQTAAYHHNVTNANYTIASTSDAFTTDCDVNSSLLNDVWTEWNYDVYKDVSFCSSTNDLSSNISVQRTSLASHLDEPEVAFVPSPTSSPDERSSASLTPGTFKWMTVKRNSQLKEGKLL